MKNLVVFSMPEDYNLDLKLGDYETFKFRECGIFQKESLGFVNTVLGSYLDTLSGGVQVLTVRTQKKVPEKAHIAHLVEEKMEKLKEVGRTNFTKDEKLSIQEEATVVVLSKTFPKAPEDHIVFVKDNLIFTEANSYKKGSVFVELIEKLLGISIPYSIQDEDPTLANVLVEDLVDPWVLGSSAKLIDMEERVVTISKGEINCEITKELLKEGAELDFVELEYDSIMTVKLKPTLEFKSIKYSKELLEESQDDEGGVVIVKIQEIIKMFNSLQGFNDE